MVAAGLLGVGLIVGGDAYRAAQRGEARTTPGEDQATDSMSDTALLGSAISLLNPLAWSVYWTVLRLRSSKPRPASASTARGPDGPAPSQAAVTGAAPPDLLLLLTLSGALCGVVGCAGADWADPNIRPLDALWCAAPTAYICNIIAATGVRIARGQSAGACERCFVLSCLLFHPFFRYVLFGCVVLPIAQFLFSLGRWPGAAARGRG